MGLHDWWMLYWEQVKETDALNWAAVLLGVAEVLLAKANKVALYPTGIAATLLSAYILLNAGLFAESLLNVYYLLMSIYGWWYWVHRKGHKQVPITRCSRRDWLIVALIVISSFVLLAIVLQLYTNSTVPYWDAWVSATAWAGMWLLSKRKIENWILLNVSNAFAIPLLMHKELPLFAALTLFLFIVAIAGYFQWQRIIRTQQTSMA